MNTAGHILKFTGLLFLMAVLNSVPYGWVATFAICMAGLWTFTK